nr:hypothetical protein [Roseibium sp. TrichSKD4]
MGKRFFIENLSNSNKQRVVAKGNNGLQLANHIIEFGIFSAVLGDAARIGRGASVAVVTMSDILEGIAEFHMGQIHHQVARLDNLTTPARLAVKLVWLNAKHP